MTAETMTKFETAMEILRKGSLIKEIQIFPNDDKGFKINVLFFDDRFFSRPLASSRYTSNCQNLESAGTFLLQTIESALRQRIQALKSETDEALNTLGPLEKLYREFFTQGGA